MAKKPPLPKPPSAPTADANVRPASGSRPAGQNTTGLVLPETAPNRPGAPTNPPVKPETLAESLKSTIEAIGKEFDRVVSLTPGQIWNEAVNGFNAQGLARVGEIVEQPSGFPAAIGARVYSALTASVATPFPGMEGKNAAGRGGAYAVAQGHSSCLVGPYDQIKDKCNERGGQAHHIVPDTLNRTSNRTDRIKGKGSIPGMPSFGGGPSICLNGNAQTAGTSHNQAHQGDREISAAGMRTDNGPLKTVPVSEAVDISKRHAKSAAPHCAKQIDDEVRKAYPDHENDKRPMNAAGRPPNEETKAYLESGGKATPAKTPIPKPRK